MAHCAQTNQAPVFLKNKFLLANQRISHSYFMLFFCLFVFSMFLWLTCDYLRSQPSAEQPTLKPPDNPLSSINLQPIEPPGQILNSTLSPVETSCAQLQSTTPLIQAPSKLIPISTMVPPKPIPGESEEDFLKRKREYWRIKKKEQRARKAIRDKGITPRRSSNNWRPILPAHGLQTRNKVILRINNIHVQKCRISQYHLGYCTHVNTVIVL